MHHQHLRLEVACDYCQRPVAIVVSRTPAADSRQQWACPWCNAENAGEYPGVIFDARKSQDGDRIRLL